MSLLPFRFFAVSKRKVLLLSLLLLPGLFTVTFGQIKAAKNEMAESNYTKAIEILHQFIQKADPKTKAEATLLMADCYRLQNDMQDARAWYFRAIRLGNVAPLTYFYYAKALRACGDYESAKKIFLRYDSLVPDDHRGKIYASFCDSAMAWDEKPFAFEVNNARNLNSLSSEFGPVFYNDGVMFATDRIFSADEDKKSGWAGNGYLKLVFAKPKQKHDFYGEYNLPKLVPEFYNDGSNDGPATFSKDGNEVFITRTVKSPDKSKDDPEDGLSNQMKIFSATKTGDKWSKWKPFFFNNNRYSVGYPSLSPDGSSLYFVSDVDGGFGGTDIYVSSRDGNDWNPPSNLGPIVNSFGDETFPFVAENGDLYFASDGHPGFGGLDIFVTRKIGNVWVIPQNLGKPINSSYDDFALAMYKNDSVGLFSADRPGGRGEDDIYSFRVVGPLPALTSQPAIAAMTKVNRKEEPKVTPKKEETKPAEKVVPVPVPATAEVKPPAEKPKQEVKTETKIAPKQEIKSEPKVTPKEEPKVAPKKEETKPAEKVIPVPAPATTEVKPPAEKPKQEVKTETKVAPKQEVKAEPKVTPKEEPKIAPKKEETKPAEKVVPVPAPATAEVKPPAEKPKQEVKTETKIAPKQEIKSEPKVTPKEEPKVAPKKEETKPAEKVIPVPAPATTEVKPPAEKPKQEVKAETKVAPKQEVKAEPKVTPKEEPKVTPKKEETKPAEKVVQVPAPATAEVKPPAEKPKQEVKTETKIAPKQEIKSEPKVIPKEEPKVAPKKEETKPAEKVVPVPAPATAEVKSSAEKPKQEVKTETKVAPKQEVKAEPKVTPKEEPKVTPKKEETKPAEKVVPVPAPATAEVKPPAEKPKQEVKTETKVAPKQEVIAEPKVTPKEEPNPAVSEQAKIIPPMSVAARVMVSGCIKDGTTQEPIPAATLFFLDENKGKVIVHKANERGCFRSPLIAGDSYRVKAMQAGYSSDCVPFYSDASGNQKEIALSSDLLLEKVGVVHTYRVDNIYYDFDRYFIRPDAEPNLNKLVQIMNENPVTVEIGAHADCRGSAEYNMILTERRAASAAHYIAQKGVGESRITKRWYGKSRLTNNCDCSEGIHCTEVQHQANRRAEFKISLPAVNITEMSVDLNRYREGDTLEVKLLPADFFKNCNRRMLGGPLAELLKSSTLLPPQQNSNLIYTVQIGAFSYLKPRFNNLSNVMSCKGNDGILRCFVGKFSSREEAIWFRDHLRSREFKDAFVAVMDEKHNPNGSGKQAYLSLK